MKENLVGIIMENGMMLIISQLKNLGIESKYY
jgi:hypothetical protein